VACFRARRLVNAALTNAEANPRAETPRARSLWCQADRRKSAKLRAIPQVSTRLAKLCRREVRE